MRHIARDAGADGDPDLGLPWVRMGARKVAVFLYGSYMSRDVLAEIGLRPERREVARLDGFDVRIRPLANLVASPGSSVWGVLCGLTHEELERLYGHARDVLGSVYLPEAVVVRTLDDRTEPALCYLASDMSDGLPAPGYVERVVRAARGLGLPEPYVAKLESFRPAPVR
jgi:hypothetical protein